MSEDTPKGKQTAEGEGISQAIGERATANVVTYKEAKRNKFQLELLTAAGLKVYVGLCSLLAIGTFVVLASWTNTSPGRGTSTVIALETSTPEESFTPMPILLPTRTRRSATETPRSATRTPSPTPTNTHISTSFGHPSKELQVSPEAWRSAFPPTVRLDYQQKPPSLPLEFMRRYRTMLRYGCWFMHLTINTIPSRQMSVKDRL
jgi:hypothetical protein